MYSVLYEADNGKKYVFGPDGATVCDMDLGDGVSVKLGTSQGFSQVGETINTRTVSGRTISVKGVVYGNIPERKKAMRNTILPFSTGRLVFDGKYYIRVAVKNAPSFSVVRNDGRFTVQFFAPFPFFYSMNGETHYIGAIEPTFHFPVNYSSPHSFGKRAAARYTNIFNGGDVAVPLSVYLSADATLHNPKLTNMKTLQTLKLNGTMNAGDEVRVYRDEQNVLHAEKVGSENPSKPEDVLSWVDEDSNLFDLEPGDNLISAMDDGHGTHLTAKLSFSIAVGAVYES